MAQGENQRLKLLFLLKILSEETDDTHGLSLHRSCCGDARKM